MHIQGVNRLETLLMAAVDLRFDQAEVYLLRNTFEVPRNLIPYILLPHHPQEGFARYANRGEDEALMKELEVEIAKVNSQREEIAMLDLVNERQVRRLQALKAVKSNLSQLLVAGGARGQSRIRLISVVAQQITQSLLSFLRHAFIYKQNLGNGIADIHERMSSLTGNAFPCY